MSWRTLQLTLLVALGLGCSASSAMAYFGGPRVVEVLGFDRTSQRIYFLFHHYADADGASTLWYFALSDSTPWEPVRGAWTGGDDDRSRPDSLRCLLEPLWPEAHLGIRLRTEILRADTMIAADDERVPRKLLGVDLHGRWGESRTEIVTYCDSRVAVAGVFTLVPYEGSRRWYTLLVLAYQGDWYGCDEVQAPILLPNDGAPVRHLGDWR